MSRNSNSLVSEIKRVRGLGAAHDGVHHFWLERVSALLLVPLSVWLVIAFINELLGDDRMTAAAWFRSPVHAILLLVFLLATALHSKLGVQVIIEDYVHCEAKKITLLLLNSALTLIFALIGVFVIARLHFIGI